MNQKKPKKNLGKFKSFKGIFIGTNNSYYCCDFYHETQDEYTVLVESPAKEKVKCNIKLTQGNWLCTDKPTPLPKELIDKIIAQIKELHQETIF